LKQKNDSSIAAIKTGWTGE